VLQPWGWVAAIPAGAELLFGLGGLASQAKGFPPKKKKSEKNKIKKFTLYFFLFS
jgi:hypothetical protein